MRKIRTNNNNCHELAIGLLPTSPLFFILNKIHISKCDKNTNDDDDENDDDKMAFG